MSKPPRRPNYECKLARPITLADGTAIVTLRDAARAIRERFGFSAARYHQLLHRIIDGPHALEYDPMLVRRLRRIREIRRRRRTADRLGFRL